MIISRIMKEGNAVVATSNEVRKDFREFQRGVQATQKTIINTHAWSLLRVSSQEIVESLRREARITDDSSHCKRINWVVAWNGDDPRAI